ncbi:MAG: flagellar hook-length control protein FliK [Planctomycetes bacterium]|nr:flagellar hook-length control protein FliK [Planctomycetota bacterium]
MLPSEQDSAAEPAPAQGALEPESFHAPKSAAAAAAPGEQGPELAPTSLDDLLAPLPEISAEPSLSTPGALNALASDAAPTTIATTTLSAGQALQGDFDSAGLAELDAEPEFEAAALDAMETGNLGEGEVQGVGAQGAAPSAASGVDATLGADAQRAPAAPESLGRSSDVAPSGAADAPAEPPRAPLDSERAAEVLRQVRLRFSPELRQAVIQLEPRELGRISIKISVARGVVRTELRAENASALEALERHAPELQAALERVGLGGGSFALQLGFDGSSAQHASDGEQQRAQHGAVPPAERPAIEGAPRALAQRLAALSGVDTYA